MINKLNIWATLLILVATTVVLGQPHHPEDPSRRRPRREHLFNWRHPVRPPAGATRFTLDGVLYFVFNDIYYRAIGDHFTIIPAPIVPGLPPKAKAVVITGITYHVCDDVYYRHGPRGYYIVEKPVSPAAPTPVIEDPKSDHIVIKVPKKDGSGEFPVTLTRRQQGGYLGPKGEFYWLLPTTGTLQRVYDTSKSPEAIATEDPLILNVPNKDVEGFTPVMLTRLSSGYLGPQGEFYPQMPKINVLTELYGQTALPAAEEADDTITLYVPNLSGEGFTPVTLTVNDAGYLGPQGEFYPTLPSIQVLSEIYGAQ